MKKLTIKKYKQNRVQFLKIEKKLKVYTFLKSYILQKKKFLYSFKKIKLNMLRFPFHNTGSKTKVVNRCMVTNRSRGVLKKFKLNRILLKDMLKVGILPGYKKATW